MAIACGHCGERHDTVAEVRNCTGTRPLDDAFPAGEPAPTVLAPDPPPMTGGSGARTGVVAVAGDLEVLAGPDALGRSLIVGPGQAAPAPWTDGPRVVVDLRALVDPTDVVAELQPLWSGRVRFVVEVAAGPPGGPAEVEAACLDHALRAHQVLGCRGLSRTDFRWDETRGVAGLILLETNTQPGMTPTSLAPEQAAHLGISFPDLVAWMVEDASCDR